MLVLLHGVTELLCNLGLPSRLSHIEGRSFSVPGESNDYITKEIEKVGKTKDH